MSKLPLAALVFCWASAAGATAEFPGTIRSHLQLDYQPPCDVCHSSAGGGGRLTKAFGIELKARGLRAGNPGSLEAALDKSQADGVDSNANGASDVDDLIAGIDPNAPGSQPLASAPPIQYGCIGRVARTPPRTFFTAWLAGTSLLALAYLRRPGGKPPREGWQ